MSGPIRTRLLDAVGATGAGAWSEQHNARTVHTLQVFFTSNPSAVIVTLEGTMDSEDGSPAVATLATWDLAGGPQVSGDIVTASFSGVNAIRANLKTLTGGTAPKVTALCNSTSS